MLPVMFSLILHVWLKYFWTRNIINLQNQNLSKLNISCPKIFESDKKTCQKVIKLCFPSSKLCFSSSKLCLRQDVTTGEVQNIMWICRHLTQSFTTHEIWSGTCPLQETVCVRHSWWLFTNCLLLLYWTNFTAVNEQSINTFQFHDNYNGNK